MSSPIDNYRNYLARNYSDMKLPAGKPYGVIKLAKGYDFGFHVRKDHVSVHFISNGTHDPEEVMGYINDNGIGDKTYGDGLEPDVSRGKRNAAVVRCEVHIPLESVDELRKPTLRKHSQQIFGELYDDFSGIVEGSEGSDKTEKVAEIKSESDDKAEVEETAGLDLSDEQVKEFKEQEEEAEDYWSYADLANEIAEAGDKDWARKLYKKAEDFAEDSSEYIELAGSVADEDYLGDKKYAKELYVQSSQLIESYKEYQQLARGIAYNLKDNDFALKFFKIAEKLIEDNEYRGLLEEYIPSERMKHLIWLADDVFDENGFNDKDYARDLYKKAESYAKTDDDFITLSSAIEKLDEEWSKNVKKGNYSTQGTLDEPNDTKSEGLSETTLVKIEIHDEEQSRAYNVVDVVFNKSIDTTNFNADSYNSLITDDDFLKKAKESIEAADGWKYGYYMDGEEISLKDVIDYVSYGDSILIRLISVGEKELPFLSVDNFSDDGKEEFLKGTLYESKLDDDDFEDNYNECIGSDNLLAFDYVINYEG